MNRAQTAEQRKEILNRLLAVWEKRPMLRLGQLIGNSHPDPYYVEDFDLIADLERLASAP